MAREVRDWRERARRGWPRRLDWPQVVGVLLMALVVCYLVAVGAQCLNSFLAGVRPELQTQMGPVHLVVDAQP